MIEERAVDDILDSEADGRVGGGSASGLDECMHELQAVHEGHRRIRCKVSGVKVGKSN